METYHVKRVYKTGLEKPHTIEIENGKRISIVYYDEKYIPQELKYAAIATDDNGTQYKLFISKNAEKALARKA